MTARPEFRTGGMRVDLVHRTLTGGTPDGPRRDSLESPGGDGWWWRVRTIRHGGMLVGEVRSLAGLAAHGATAPMPDMVTAALAHPMISIEVLAEVGVPMTDPTLAAAILDDPAVAGKLGIDPDTIDPVYETGAAA